MNSFGSSIRDVLVSGLWKVAGVGEKLLVRFRSYLPAVRSPSSTGSREAGGTTGATMSPKAKKGRFDEETLDRYLGAGDRLRGVVGLYQSICRVRRYAKENEAANVEAIEEELVERYLSAVADLSRELKDLEELPVPIGVLEDLLRESPANVLRDILELQPTG